jgi:hypothetical protein
MQVLVNETQVKRILNENLVNNITKKLDNLVSFTNATVKDLLNSYKFHIRFILTYGAGIGAILEPTIKYLNSQHPVLTDTQLKMIAISAIMIVFYENRDFKKLEKRISDDSLENELSSAVSYVSKLKEKVKSILDVVGLSIYRVSDILSYTFLLPLLGELMKVINMDIQDIDYDFISKSILNATGIIITGSVIKRLVEMFLRK